MKAIRLIFIKIAIASLIITSGCAPKSIGEAEQSFNPKSNNQNFSYFGDSTKEVEFNFSSRLLISSAGKPSDEKIKTEIKKALKFTLGKMHKDGSIYGNSEINILQVNTLGPMSYLVVYEVSGKAVFKKDLKTYTFYTPFSMKTIYQAAEGKCHIADPEISDLNYWYHWNPDISGCPLVLNTHYFKSESTLKVIEATKNTYPEYEKMFENKQLKATIFVGPASHEMVDFDPSKNKDEGAKDFAGYKKLLLDAGFRGRLLTTDQVNDIIPLGNNAVTPYVMEFVKTANSQVLRYRLIFCETAFYNKNSVNFHFLLADALKNESLVVYSGHSGVGRNLNLNMIEAERKIKLNLSTQYQIMFFGSCLPYAYYMDMFFSRKVSPKDVNGTKNLEILGYAKEGHFGNNDSYRLIEALNNFAENGVKTSYQHIVSSNPVDFYGVIGDEDNVK